jgi:hypothetical protein
VKRVIVVGGSAGAISAFGSVLKAIPRNFRAFILAVIHIGEDAHTFIRCPATVQPLESHRSENLEEILTRL